MTIVGFLISALRETWRLLRLFAAGVAWGAPFILLSFVNDNPGAASHPTLALPLARVQIPLLLATPLFAIAGVIVVAWLSKRERRLGVASVLALCIVGVAAGSVYLLYRRFGGADSWPVFLAVMVVGGVLAVSLPVLGVAVTAATLWRRWRWSAGVWLLAWTLLSVTMWLGSTQTGGKDLGGGLLASFASSALLVAALGASFLAFLVTGLLAPRAKAPGDVAANR